MIKKTAIALLVLSTLTGCMRAHYFFDGKKYDDEESFQAAVDSNNAAAVDAVVPLPAPLSNKKLMVSIPNEQAIYAENERRALANTGRPLRGIGIEQNKNLSRSNYQSMRVFYEGVKKRGIYRDVVIQDSASITTSLEPSADYDVMYYTEPAAGSGQTFFASKKYGKQAFAFDRSGVGSIAKVQAFITAVEAMAVRE